MDIYKIDLCNAIFVAIKLEETSMPTNRASDKWHYKAIKVEWTKSKCITILRVQNCQMFPNGKISFQDVKYMHIFLYVGLKYGQSTHDILASDRLCKDREGIQIGLKFHLQ